MQIPYNPNHMDRVHMAANIYNDPSLIDKHQLKFNRRSAPKPIKQSQSYKSDGLKPKIKQSDVEEYLDQRLQEQPKPKSEPMTGKVAPVNYKIQTQKQEFQTRNPESAPAIQRSRDVVNPKMKTCYPNYEVQQTEVVEFDLPPIKITAKTATVHKTPNIIKNIMKNQKSQNETNDDAVPYDDAQLFSCSNRDPSARIKAQLSKTQSKSSKQRQSPVCVKKLYGLKLQPSFASQQSILNTQQQDAVKSTGSIKAPSSNLQENNDKVVKNQQITTILLKELQNKTDKIQAALHSKLSLRTKREITGLKKLKQELSTKRSKLLTRIYDLQQLLTESVLLNREEKKRIYREQKQIHQKALQLVVIDPILLQNLHDYFIQLSDVTSLWISQGTLSCMSCMKQYGMSQEKIGDKLVQLGEGNADEQQGDIQELQQIRSDVSSQLNSMRKTKKLEISEVQNLNVSAVDYDQNQDQVRISQNTEQTSQQQRVASGKHDDKEQKVDELKHPVTNNSPNPNAKKQLISQQNFSNINIFDIQQLKNNPKNTRIVIYPCGDSVCGECSIGEHCPICFGPVVKKVITKVKIYNEFFGEKLKTATAVMERTCEALTELIRLCEQ